MTTANELSKLIKQYELVITERIMSSSFQQISSMKESGYFSSMNPRIEKANKHLKKLSEQYENLTQEIKCKLQYAMEDYLISVGCCKISEQWEITLDGYKQRVDCIGISYFYSDMESGMARLTIGNGSQTYNFKILDKFIRFETDNCMY
jgi:hypothetical protein